MVDIGQFCCPSCCPHLWYCGAEDGVDGLRRSRLHQYVLLVVCLTARGEDAADADLMAGGEGQEGEKVGDDVGVAVDHLAGGIFVLKDGPGTDTDISISRIG